MEGAATPAVNPEVVKEQTDLIRRIKKAENHYQVESRVKDSSISDQA